MYTLYYNISKIDFATLKVFYKPRESQFRNETLFSANSGASQTIQKMRRDKGEKVNFMPDNAFVIGHSPP